MLTTYSQKTTCGYLRTQKERTHVQAQVLKRMKQYGDSAYKARECGLHYLCNFQSWYYFQNKTQD